MNDITINKTTSTNTNSGFRLVDFLIIIVFLVITAISINLFRNDLLQTINLRNVEPVGYVIVRKNIVQRRLADRVLWDRLGSESPVYLGDLIRVAELSSATLYIDGNSIDLNENTLIRLTRAPDGESLQIIMSEGNLSLAAGADSGRISFDVNGRFIQVGSDYDPLSTILNVTSADDGMVLQVNEGIAQLIEDGRIQEIHAGSQLALDAAGAVREERAAVITHPAFNARYINDSNTPFTVSFSWNRINFNDSDLLQLEIASDRNFNHILHTQQNLNRNAQTVLNNGLWYWRLSFADTVLYEGRFSIIDGAGPRLHSPAINSVFRYTEELPVLNFQWNEVDEASSYIIEVCNTPDFTSPRIQRQSQITFLTDSNLGAGTWYWRVRPVFSSVYIGNSSFSQTSSFNIVHAVIGSELPQPITPQLRLTAPVRGARIEGLTASRQQTVFSWEYEAEFTSSRLVLSRNSNPFQGRPAIEIQNPDRNVSVNNLTEGTWYWNVEIQTADGLTASASQHSMLQVLPIPALPAAQNLQPVRGRRFSMSDLQTQRNLGFSWDAVRGANAYILTIFHQTETGRQQVFQTRPPITATNYQLENLRFLDRGTFIWQVEAVNRGQGGTIEQRGNIAESTFIMDIILPGAIHVEGTGVIDGN
jgi:hypothetical protein